MCLCRYDHSTNTLLSESTQRETKQTTDTVILYVAVRFLTTLMPVVAVVNISDLNIQLLCHTMAINKQINY